MPHKAQDICDMRLHVPQDQSEHDGRNSNRPKNQSEHDGITEI